jgi:hypothetical protein
VADIIASRLEALDLQYPTVPSEELAKFEQFRRHLAAD